jgi:hypothetical protein
MVQLLQQYSHEVFPSNLNHHMYINGPELGPNFVGKLAKPYLLLVSILLYVSIRKPAHSSITSGVKTAYTSKRVTST